MSPENNPITVQGSVILVNEALRAHPATFAKILHGSAWDNWFSYDYPNGALNYTEIIQDQITSRELSERINKLAKNLTTLERGRLVARYGLTDETPQSLQVIANHQGVHLNAVRYSVDRALYKTVGRLTRDSEKITNFVKSKHRNAIILATLDIHYLNHLYRAGRVFDR